MTVFGQPFVTRFALCYRTVVCPVLSCLSVCNVGVLWPNGLTDQDETWQAGRPRPGHIVLDGDPAPLPQRGTAPTIFDPYPLRPNGCIDQDATWYGRIDLGLGDFVLDWDPAPSLNFRPMIIIVIVMSLEHCTGVTAWFVQVQVQV